MTKADEKVGFLVHHPMIAAIERCDQIGDGDKEARSCAAMRSIQIY